MQLNLKSAPPVGFMWGCGCIVPFSEARERHECPRRQPLVIDRTFNIGPVRFTQTPWADADRKYVYLAAPISSADPLVVVKTTRYSWLTLVQIGVAYAATFPDKSFKSKVRVYPDYEVDPRLEALDSEKTVEYSYRFLGDLGIPEDVIKFMIYKAGPCNQGRWPWLNTGAERCNVVGNAACVVRPSLYQPRIDGEIVSVIDPAISTRTDILDVICPRCGQLSSESGFALKCARFCATPPPPGHHSSALCEVANTAATQN